MCILDTDLHHPNKTLPESVRSVDWLCYFFFFNDTSTTEIYTLSLHDALPISRPLGAVGSGVWLGPFLDNNATSQKRRSEEHTSELQSQSNLVCRLLLEKKNNTHFNSI